MSSFYKKIISIISKPAENRNINEIELILDWFVNLFKKKSAVFGEIQSEVVKDIIKNCSFETKRPDEIIIKQGDVGDCFYINLRGKVSIYINHRKHDELDNLDENAQVNTEDISDQHYSEILNLPGKNEKRSKKIREKLGNYVTSLGAGEGFGEIALVSDDTRTASIIADEETDLMVVNKILYARCLQAPTLRKLNEKKEFINSSPFFGNWSMKAKKLLSLCLERDILPSGSFLGKQGDTADRIYFMISGQAKVTVNPMIHQLQYPRLYPLKLPENEEQDIINQLIEEKNALFNNMFSNRNQTSKVNQNNHILKRRNETFAEAEQRIKSKNVEVGILGAGEIVGMCEIINDMSTYMQTTVCLEDCDVFYIFKRSYERLIAKRNPFCINKMRENVYLKLVSRNNRLRNSTPIDLFRSIQYKCELSKKRSMSEMSAHTTVSAFNKSMQAQNKIIRGPIIQLDLRPKTAAYNRMKNLSKMSRNAQIKAKQLNEAEINEILMKKYEEQQEKQEVIEYENNIESKMKQEAFKNIKTTATNDPKIEEVKSSTDHALEILEDKIKKWHLDSGCVKPHVEKLNRINIQKIKADVKNGENVLVRRFNAHLRLPREHNRSRSSSNDSISSENSSLDNMNEYMTYSTSNFFMNQSRFSNENSTNSISTATNVTPLVFRGTLFSNLLKCIESDENQHGTLTSANNSSAFDSNSQITESRSIPIGFFKPNIEASTTFMFNNINNNNANDSNTSRNNSSSQSSNPSSNEMKNSSNEKFKIEPMMMEHSNNEEEFMVNKTVRRPPIILINEKSATRTNRKKLMPNIDRQNSIVNQLLKKKFSLGQLKLQNSGKQYSKEEYAALKDELKKQSRRFSVSSITSFT